MQQYCHVPPLQGLLFSVAWGHVEGLCKSGLPTIQMKPPTWVTWSHRVLHSVIHSKLNHEQLPIISITQSLTIYYRIITEGRPRQFILSRAREAGSPVKPVATAPIWHGPSDSKLLNQRYTKLDGTTKYFCQGRVDLARHNITKISLMVIETYCGNQFSYLYFNISKEMKLMHCMNEGS